MIDSIRQALRRAYDSKAAERDRAELAAWKAGERARFLEHLRQEEKRTLLEIGAGTGRDGRFFADEGLDVTCVDLSPEMVRLCRAKGLRAEVMDASRLAFADGSFDAAYAFNSLLHIPKAELPAVLAEIRRVLEPGALFYMGLYGGSDFAGIWEEDNYEPRRFFAFYRHEAIQSIVGATFELVSFRPVPLSKEKGATLDFQSMIWRKKAGVYEKPAF